MTDHSSLPTGLLQRAFDRLPTLQQQILLMARVDRLSYAEIGERIGLPRRDIERQLAKALARLDRELERIKWQEPRSW